MSKSITPVTRTQSRIIGKDRVIITCELTDLGYFSVTGEIKSKYATRASSGWSYGQNYQPYARYFRRMAKLFNWHLFSPVYGPMHYVENALHWAGHSPKWPQSMYYGQFYPANEENLKRTILYGTLEDDLMVDPMSLSAANLRVWLHRRFIPLVAKFEMDMLDFFGDDFDPWLDQVQAYETERHQTTKELADSLK